MARIEYKNDQNRATEEAEGSDGRLNTSGRVDGRAYYNSRDSQLCFTVPFDFQASESGEFATYWQNTSSDKDLVISSIGINSFLASRIKLHFVSGVASGGNDVTPTNLNKSSSKDAPSNSREGGSGATGINGITSISVIDFLTVGAGMHEEFRLSDRVRLGQNDAIAIEVAETAGGATADVFGVIFGYFE